MKAFGYVSLFSILLFCSWILATRAPDYNVELGMFFGALILVIMAVTAGYSGDLD